MESNTYKNTHFGLAPLWPSQQYASKKLSAITGVKTYPKQTNIAASTLPCLPQYEGNEEACSL